MKPKKIIASLLLSLFLFMNLASFPVSFLPTSLPINICLAEEPNWWEFSEENYQPSPTDTMVPPGLLFHRTYPKLQEQKREILQLEKELEEKTTSADPKQNLSREEKTALIKKIFDKKQALIRSLEAARGSNNARAREDYQQYINNAITGETSGIETIQNRHSEITGSQGVKPWDLLFQPVGQILGRVAAIVIGLAAFVLTFICKILLESVVVPMVKAVFTPSFYQDIGGFATNEIVNQGWKVVVGFCNLIFIVGLLFIGVGTIFRIEKYNYKKNLLTLIIVALLLNFSLVFSGVILDFFHVLMFSIPNPLIALTQSINQLVQDTIVEYLTLLLGGLSGLLIPGLYSLEDVFDQVSELVLKATFIMATMIALFAIALFLIIRTVGLWLLLILSPFAYASLAMPDLAGISKKWWGSFLGYALSGPLMFFFLWLSSEMIKVSFPEAWSLTSAASGDSNSWLHLIAAMVLLWGSLISAASLGLAGAGAIMGVAKVALGAGAAMAGSGGMLLLAGKGVSMAANFMRGHYNLKSDLLDAKIEAADAAGDTATADKLKAEKEGWEAKRDKAEHFASRASWLGTISNPAGWGRYVMYNWKKAKESSRAEEAEAIEKTFDLIKGGVFSLGGGGLKARQELARLIQTRKNRKDLEKNKNRQKELSGLNDKEFDQYMDFWAKQENGTALTDEEQQTFNALTAQHQQKDQQDHAELEALNSKAKEEGLDEKEKKRKEDLEKRIKEREDLAQAMPDLLNVEKQAERIKEAAKSVWKIPLDEATYFDKVKDQKVQEALAQLEHINDYRELAQRFKIASSSEEKEAILLKMWTLKEDDTLLGELGFNSDDHLKLLEQLPKRRALLLAGVLDKIAVQSGNLRAAGLLVKDSQTGRIRLAQNNQERGDNISRLMSDPTTRSFIDQMKKDLFFSLRPDGSMQFNHSAPHLFKRMTEGVIAESHLMKAEVVRYLEKALRLWEENGGDNDFQKGAVEIGMTEANMDVIRKILEHRQGRAGAQAYAQQQRRIKEQAAEAVKQKIKDAENFAKLQEAGLAAFSPDNFDDKDKNKDNRPSAS